MRTLKFIVEGQIIKPDPSCNFSGLFPGKYESIQAEFSFSPEWTTVPKVAAFYSMLEKEFSPQLIDKDNGCAIPPEALTLPAFKMEVLGNNRGEIIETNKLIVYQKGGKYESGTKLAK